jgi:hypothetical protein
MTQQYLNIGAAPGDHTGDTLRTGGQKINANFAELYTTLAASTLPSKTGNAGKALYTDGSLLYWGVVTATNGVVTTGNYVNPSWIASLSASKITGQVPSAQSLVNGIYTLSFNANGTLTFPNNTVQSTAYLGTATTTQIGGVKPDGTTITINNGIISAASAYTLPTATTSVLGGVKVDGTSITINNGIISGASTYTLPTATTSVLGGVKVDGTSIIISNGIISTSVTGSVIFKGTWNAATNTPTLASGTGTTGWQYAVSVAGTRNLGGGSQIYNVGDFIIYDGTNWIDISGNSGVTTFNTRAGAVTLTSGDVTTALGFTPIQSSNITVATTTASGGGSLTYNAGTFTFAPASIPAYTVNTLAASGPGSLSITGTVLTFTPAAAYALPIATTSVLGGVKIDNNTIVINNGVISVGGALTSATIFKGSWDASTNTPTLGSGTGVAGYEYIVSVGATRDIGNGSTVWSVGDLVIYDGAKWVRIPSGNNVVSFNTRQGAITLTSADVTTALGFTPGTVTSTSVVSANGFAGTVATNTATPAITISTSITGLLKGNGTAISAATGGTDYISPSTTGQTITDTSGGTNYTLKIANGTTGAIFGFGTGSNAYGIANDALNNTISGYVPYTVSASTITFKAGASVPATALSIASNGTVTIGTLAGLLKGTSGVISAAAASDINTTFGSQTQNYVYAAPGSGGNGNPAFRSLVAADIPTIHNAITVTGGSLTFSGNISAAAWTTNGIRHVSSPATLTDTTSTGTVVNAYTNNFGGNTIAASNTVTYTNYSTVFLNDPVAGTNVTITNAYSLITAGNIKLGSTGTGTITAVAATATTASTAASVGYLGSPINTQASTYTLVIGDTGKTIYAGGNLTIPANASVAFPVGTIVNVIASAGITIAITTDTLQWGGQATSQTGTRTVAAYGMASLQKVTNTIWYISGVGVT